MRIGSRAPSLLALLLAASGLRGATRDEGQVPGLDRPIDIRLASRAVPAAGRRVGLALRRARLFPPAPA